MAALLGWLPAHDGPPRFEIRVEPAGVWRPPDAEPERYGEMEVWREREALLVHHPSGAFARVAVGVAVISARGPATVRAFRQLFPFIVTHLLAPGGRFVVHAGVVAIDGKAVLLLGVTGAGKSTLVHAARLDGWAALGDDLAVVRARDGEVEGRAIARPLNVPAEVGMASGASLLAGDPRGRWELPVAVSSDWLLIGAVVHVVHGSDRESDLGSWEATAVLRTLVGAFASAPEVESLQRWLPVAAALSRLPAWELRHGTDPSTRLAGAARSLAAVRTRLGRDLA